MRLLVLVGLVFLATVTFAKTKEDCMRELNICKDRATTMPAMRACFTGHKLCILGIAWQGHQRVQQCKKACKEAFRNARHDAWEQRLSASCPSVLTKQGRQCRANARNQYREVLRAADQERDACIAACR